MQEALDEQERILGCTWRPGDDTSNRKHHGKNQYDGYLVILQGDWFAEHPKYCCQIANKAAETLGMKILNQRDQTRPRKKR